MKQNKAFAVLLISVGLSLAACAKKKTEDQPAAKPTDPAAAVAPTGSGAPTPGSAATGAAPGTAPAAAPTGTKNVLETAKQAGSFTVFLKAVDTAGIASNFDGAGPFTVFAPTDEAFAKIAPKDLDALLADKAKLAKLLQYHVVSGNVLAKDLAAAKAEKSIEGADLTVDASAGLKVGGATVVKPDLVASNGVIHGIDTVLTPPAQ